MTDTADECNYQSPLPPEYGAPIFNTTEVKIIPPWADCPVDTVAVDNSTGCSWKKQPDGRWRAKGGDAFPTPGGSVSFVCYPRGYEASLKADELFGKATKLPGKDPVYGRDGVYGWRLDCLGSKHTYLVRHGADDWSIMHGLLRYPTAGRMNHEQVMGWLERMGRVKPPNAAPAASGQLDVWAVFVDGKLHSARAKQHEADVVSYGFSDDKTVEVIPCVLIPKPRTDGN